MAHSFVNFTKVSDLGENRFIARNEAGDQATIWTAYEPRELSELEKLKELNLDGLVPITELVGLIGRALIVTPLCDAETVPVRDQTLEGPDFERIFEAVLTGLVSLHEAGFKHGRLDYGCLLDLPVPLLANYWEQPGTVKVVDELRAVARLMKKVSGGSAKSRLDYAHPYAEILDRPKQFATARDMLVAFKRVKDPEFVTTRGLALPPELLKQAADPAQEEAVKEEDDFLEDWISSTEPEPPAKVEVEPPAPAEPGPEEDVEQTLISKGFTEEQVAELLTPAPEPEAKLSEEDLIAHTLALAESLDKELESIELTDFTAELPVEEKTQAISRDEVLIDEATQTIPRSELSLDARTREIPKTELASGRRLDLEEQLQPTGALPSYSPEEKDEPAKPAGVYVPTPVLVAVGLLLCFLLIRPLFKSSHDPEPTPMAQLTGVPVALPSATTEPSPTPTPQTKTPEPKPTPKPKPKPKPSPTGRQIALKPNYPQAGGSRTKLESRGDGKQELSRRDLDLELVLPKGWKLSKDKRLKRGDAVVLEGPDRSLSKLTVFVDSSSYDHSKWLNSFSKRKELDGYDTLGGRPGAERVFFRKRGSSNELEVVYSREPGRYRSKFMVLEFEGRGGSQDQFLDACYRLLNDFSL